MRKENKVIALAETRRRLPKSPKASQRNTRINSATTESKKLVGLSPAEKRRKTILSKKRTILFERDIEYIGGDVFLEICEISLNSLGIGLLASRIRIF